MMKSIETMKWIEGEARNNAEFQINCADALEKQASALLHLLLAGAGGALAYAVSLSEKHAASWQQAGMACTAIWLFIVAAILLVMALWSRPTYGPANDPENLHKAYEMELGVALKFELQNRQFCITKNRDRNDSVGRWLNICRALAAATPMVFIAAAVLLGD
jgi:hypothetical protein